MRKTLLAVFLAGLVVPLVTSKPANALFIDATFDANLSASSIDVINNAIAFYQTTFSDPITVNLGFYNMDRGLASSMTYVTTQPYATYRTALGLDATSADDATALANTPGGANNPVTGSTSINMKTANARAVGLAAPGGSFTFSGSPCNSFFGDSCIGLNLGITNDVDVGGGPGYSLISIIEHEINEALGLGSQLPDLTFLGGHPMAEDLFRWASAGVRSFATNGCGGEPAAFFSIDGGVTELNHFNNCTNNGDYGDWITHTPTQVQDAFSDNSGSPFLTATSPEVRALDVIGYTLARQIPEPSMLALLGIGLAGLGLGRRKRAS